MTAVHHLLLLALLYGALHTNADTQKWHQVQVSNVTLDKMSPRDNRSARSVAQCTMMAIRDPLDQLLCFRTPGICTKYDYRVEAGHNDLSSDPVTSCWTKHLPGESHSNNTSSSAKCDENGEVRLNDNCSITVCNQGSMMPYQAGQTTLNLAPSDLLVKNCIRVNMTKHNTWESGRDFCVSQGGDLFVPGDLNELLDYLSLSVPGNGHVIVGAKNGKWLDGRPLTGITGNGGDYIYWKSNGGLHLHNNDHKGYPLCQIGVRYP